jgi:hypothetical protein
VYLIIPDWIRTSNLRLRRSRSIRGEKKSDRGQISLFFGQSKRLVNTVRLANVVVKFTRFCALCNGFSDRSLTPRCHLSRAVGIRLRPGALQTSKFYMLEKWELPPDLSIAAVLAKIANLQMRSRPLNSLHELRDTRAVKIPRRAHFVLKKRH